MATRIPGWGLVAGAGALATAAGAGALGLREAFIARHAESIPEEWLELPPPNFTGTVRADDGVGLHVRETGFSTAPLTVVFTHGYCQRMDGWCLQARRLREAFGDDVRLLFWDQRGHGSSEEPEREHCTIEWTARDLAAVLRERVPYGDVVLVGHSMGGMTTMALARVAPELMERVRAVALVATAASGLEKGGIPQMVLNPVGSTVVRGAAMLPQLVNQVRVITGRWALPVVRGGSFGDQKVARQLVLLNERMIDDTDSTTILNFFGTLQIHDETAGLEKLAGIPGVVVAGDRDLMIPFERAVDIIEHWPGARLVRARGAGHMVQLEQPEVVGDALETLVREAWHAA
ncbi:alpha/beta fold hydrolase [Corynebacterium sp. 335C]